MLLKWRYVSVQAECQHDALKADMWLITTAVMVYSLESHKVINLLQSTKGSHQGHLVHQAHKTPGEDVCTNVKAILSGLLLPIKLRYGIAGIGSTPVTPKLLKHGFSFKGEGLVGTPELHFRSRVLSRR